MRNAGLSSIYEIIKDKLEVSKFRRIASKALLSQPATIAEFKSIPKSVIDYLDENKEMPIQLSNLRFPDIENMRHLNPVEAVSFCRNHLCKSFSDMHREIGGRDIRHFGESRNHEGFKRNTPQLAADGIKRIRIQLRDVSVGQLWLNAAAPLSDAILQ